MPTPFRTAVAALLLGLSAALAAGQQTGPLPVAKSAAAGANVVSSPKSASSEVPSLKPGDPMRYRSAFEGYRPLTEEPVGSWSEANGLVGRIGGWQSYAREGQAEPAAGSAGSMSPSGMQGMPGMAVDNGGMNMQPSGHAAPPPMSPAASGTVPAKGVSPQTTPSGASAPKAAGVPATTPASAEKPAGHSGHKNPNP